MKKLFALSLLSTAALLADNAPKPSFQRADECCKPCCIPKPKKCIDCECYSPAFYESNGCDAGVFITADFLYWYARESHLSYVAKETAVAWNPGTTDNSLGYTNIKHLETKWAPGFRVGIGFLTDWEGWDVFLNYTWYHNKKKDHTSVPNFGTAGFPFTPFIGQETLLNPWINPTLQWDGRPAQFNRVNALWNLTLNDLDFEIGKKFRLSPAFTLRPYAALRGVWLRKTFSTLSLRDNTEIAPISITYKDRFKNRYWGAGIELGLQPEWYFIQKFALISNIDAALLWGRFRDKKDEDYTSTGLTTPIDFHQRFKNNFSHMQSILDLMLGFRWDETWACDRYHTALDIGWEQHIWFDFSNMIKQNSVVLVGGGPGGSFQSQTQSYEENEGNLIFGGLTVRFRFDF